MLLKLIEQYDREVLERIHYLEEENRKLREELNELTVKYMRSSERSSLNMLNAAVAGVMMSGKDPKEREAVKSVFDAVNS